jgi:hypothetical protein
MTYKRTPREFRPRSPELKDWLSPAFLVLLFTIIAPGIAAHPTRWQVLGLAGCLLLIIGAIWLQLRGRWPGKPLLRVSKDGMSYVRSGSVRSLAWSEIVAMPVDFTLKRMSFVPRSGKPIHMRHDLVAEDGTAWLMVIEDYWRAPRGKPRSKLTDTDVADRTPS